MKPFTMSRFLSIFFAEGETEIDGNVAYVWEPLHYQERIDADARPSWDDMHITFFRKAERDWVRVNRHMMFSRGASPDVLVMPSGACIEITTGTCVYRGDRWFIRWQGYTHTRMAKLVRAGLDVWKAAE